MKNLAKAMMMAVLAFSPVLADEKTDNEIYDKVRLRLAGDRRLRTEW
jgi:hypothetical protein